MVELVNSKKEFELSDEELLELLEAMHDPKVVGMDGKPLCNAYERCNYVWKKIAASRGLNWKTIMPSKRGPEYFTATKSFIIR